MSIELRARSYFLIDMVQSSINSLFTLGLTLFYLYGNWRFISFCEEMGHILSISFYICEDNRGVQLKKKYAKCVPFPQKKR